VVLKNSSLLTITSQYYSLGHHSIAVAAGTKIQHTALTCLLELMGKVIVLQLHLHKVYHSKTRKGEMHDKQHNLQQEDNKLLN